VQYATTLRVTADNMNCLKKQIFFRTESFDSPPGTVDPSYVMGSQLFFLFIEVASCEDPPGLKSLSNRKPNDFEEKSIT